MTVSEPYSWLGRIDEALLSLEQKPQFGGPVDFPWNDLQQALRTQLARPSLTLSHHIKGWVQADHLADGLGFPLHVQSIVVPELKYPLYWIMSHQDLQELFAELLGGEEISAFFAEKEYLEGFHQYLTLEVLAQINQTHFTEDLLFRLGDAFSELDRINEPCFVVDVDVNFDKRRIVGRLLMTESFRQDWKKFHAQKPSPPLSKEMARKLSVDIALEAGYSQLKWTEWKGIRTGDFLILDRCSVIPEEKQGSVILSLEGRPLFRANIQENGIKLEEYPFYEEGEAPMDREDFEEEEDEDEDLFASIDEEEEDEDFEDLLRKASLKKEERRIEEEEAEEIEEESAPQEKIKPSMVRSEGGGIAPEQLPVQLVVEVGRIRMTAEELMNLSPGVLIEIPVAPEQGVDLVMNGKKVGRGELLKFGDVLGVRILSL